MSIINKSEDRNITRIATRRNRINKKSKIKLKDILLNHIYKNLKEYLIVTIIFVIGIIAGVIFVNNVNESQAVEIQEYINNFVNALKGDYSVDKGELLKKSLIENLKLTITMWLIGSTVIGMPVVLGIVLVRAFCIGYTISASIAILGVQKGTIFFLSAVFLQNIIFIPVLIALAVSGIKLYKSIMKDKRKENIKIEIVRHTLSSILLFGLLIIASLVEVYISVNLVVACVNIL